MIFTEQKYKFIYVKYHYIVRLYRICSITRSKTNLKAKQIQSHLMSTSPRLPESAPSIYSSVLASYKSKNK